MNEHSEFAALGTATVYEASGRQGLVDIDLIQVVPGSQVAGPARTVRCGQDDNLAVHAAISGIRRGDVLVVAMPEPRPVALVGELLAIQARYRGAAAILVDAAIRDLDGLAVLGLPIWARWIRVRGATKQAPGLIGGLVNVGGVAVGADDIVVLDRDGAVVVPASRAHPVLQAARERRDREAAKRRALQTGSLSFELDGLRERLEARQ